MPLDLDSMRECRWYPSESVFFCKTREPWGELSNMAADFPLLALERETGKLWYHTEGLYQACRYPHLPHVQEAIRSQKNPMQAKMLSKQHTASTRPDWEQVKVEVMAWCLAHKFFDHYDRLGVVLRATSQYIVEKSHKDTFWGAVDSGNGYLRGRNVLGHLWMNLRTNHRLLACPLDPVGLNCLTSEP